jgi:uncharacterized membrane protein YGL010W
MAKKKKRLAETFPQLMQILTLKVLSLSFFVASKVFSSKPLTVMNVGLRLVLVCWSVEPAVSE